MTPDFNLLLTLDVLLAEGSVARAAKRLRLSPSAMSRSLARLREATGDPLLVRAGRGLVASPRAVELRTHVSHLVQEAQAILRPQENLEIKNVERIFTLRVSEGFAETFGPHLLALISKEAPGIVLRFMPKTDRDGTGLRDGSVDLETGVVAKTTGPEIRTQLLFRDQFVAVMRKGHTLSTGKLTAARYAAADHIFVSRQGLIQGPIDEALKPLQRNAAVVVGGFATAIALARKSNLVASVPQRHTEGLRQGMVSLPLPLSMQEIPVSMLWHPRLDADLAHRWLRDCVRRICADKRGKV